MKKRASGILMHISSLPSKYGIGDFGPEAFAFADFLARAGQRYWQVLPLTKTELQYGNSPYSSPSAFAGNILFISPEILLREGLVNKDELGKPAITNTKVNYKKVTAYKIRLLNRVFERRDRWRSLRKKFEKFCAANDDWLNDYALFEALRIKYPDLSWARWPKQIRVRNNKTIQKVLDEQSHEIEKIKFFQFIFFSQWRQLKRYCNSKKIKIIGDLPIYVNYESVDVWVNPHIFRLNKNFRQRYSAGVPPDYFSSTGQLWGNPVYDWDVLKRGRFKWWVNRIRHKLDLYDFIRLDHFRGFAAYWQVPFGSKTAVKGKWVRVPGKALFGRIKKELKDVPFIAEDIGYITPDVRALMKEFGFPGMKVLQFAFDGTENNEYLPHHYDKNCIVYTGTHDNNTLQGWFKNEIDQVQRRQIKKYLGRKVSYKSLHWDLIELVMASKANTAVIPMQDVLGLGAGSKMNRPGTGSGNWQWRMTSRASKSIERKLNLMTSQTGRI